ncbi:hypothetical protein FPV67DRAFT_919583 [Lyophyllum atratum]|nr:hypothetical protein FPV67DRAFT_919583 [Lyophyllum atratum]
MVKSRLSIVSFFCILFALANAQHNITVNYTSPSIQYEGNAADALTCKINPNGTLPAGQPGCYNVPSHCTQGASMGQGGSGAASFSFKGSAIYIDSLLNFWSPIFTVTIDGKSTDVNGVRSPSNFICAPLFSQTGFDPNVEHKVRLSVKGPSPNRNTSNPHNEDFITFSLISYTFTEGGNGNATTTDGASNATATNGASNATATNGANLNVSDAGSLRLSGWEAVASIVAISWSLLL